MSRAAPRAAGPASRRQALGPARAGLLPVALLALLLVAPTPAAAREASPSEFSNGQPTTFGAAALPAYLQPDNASPLRLEVPIVIHPAELATPAFRYLVGFDVHGDGARVTDLALTANGKPVVLERTEDDPQQPRLVLPGDSLPRDGEVRLLLAGTVKATADGQVHVGALAMAFDAAWGTLRTHDGSPAQAYGFTLLMSTGHATHGLAPRFVGQGNTPTVLLPLLALLAVAARGLHTAYRRLWPAPAKPRPARLSAPPTPAPVPRIALPAPTRPPQRIAPLPYARLPPAAPPAVPAPLPVQRGPRPTAVRRRKVRLDGIVVAAAETPVPAPRRKMGRRAVRR